MKNHIYIIIAIITISALMLVGCDGNDEPSTVPNSNDGQDIEAQAEPDVTPPSYEIVSDEDYGASLDSHSWRIIIDENVSDEQLLYVYEELNDKKYEEVTLWFYKSAESVNLGAFDVAMIERIGKEEPTIIYQNFNSV